MALYALYKGDDLLDVGTAREIAERRGVKPSTIQFMATPAHKRRDRGNLLVAERIDDGNEAIA